MNSPPSDAAALMRLLEGLGVAMISPSMISPTRFSGRLANSSQGVLFLMGFGMVKASFPSMNYSIQI